MCIRDRYENFDKLTIAMLNEFIEKILVHERDRKGSIQTTQVVEIYFNFVGRFVPPVSYTHLDVYKRQMETYAVLREAFLSGEPGSVEQISAFKKNVTCLLYTSSAMITGSWETLNIRSMSSL